MASFPIIGAASIDDCSAGPGACEANHCAGTCQNNAYQMAWPNYGDCISDHHCNANTTSVPYAGAHQCGNAPIVTYQKDCSNRATNPAFKDCGPPGGTYTTGGYCGGSRHEIIACLNSAAFSFLCDGCNPATTHAISLTFELG